MLVSDNAFARNIPTMRREERAISTSVYALVLTLDASQSIFANLLPKYTRSGVTFIYFGIKLSKMICSGSEGCYSIFGRAAKDIENVEPRRLLHME